MSPAVSEIRHGCQFLPYSTCKCRKISCKVIYIFIQLCISLCENKFHIKVCSSIIYVSKNCTHSNLFPIYKDVFLALPLTLWLLKVILIVVERLRSDLWQCISRELQRGTFVIERDLLSQMRLKNPSYYKCFTTEVSFYSFLSPYLHVFLNVHVMNPKLSNCHHCNISKIYVFTSSLSTASHTVKSITLNGGPPSIML